MTHNLSKATRFWPMRFQIVIEEQKFLLVLALRTQNSIFPSPLPFGQDDVRIKPRIRAFLR